MFSHAPLALATLHFNTESKLTNACLQFSLQLLHKQWTIRSQRDRSFGQAQRDFSKLSNDIISV